MNTLIVRELNMQEEYKLKERHNQGTFASSPVSPIPKWLNTPNVIGIIDDVIYVKGQSIREHVGQLANEEMDPQHIRILKQIDADWDKQIKEKCEADATTKAISHQLFGTRLD